MLKKHIIVNYIGQGCSSLLTFLVVPFYLKLLGVESYGIIGFYSVLFTLFGVFDFATALNWKLAQGSADIEKNKDQMRDTTRTLEWILWGLCLFIILSLWTLAPVIVDMWLNVENLSREIVLISIRFMSFSIIGTILLHFYRSALMGLHKQVAANVLLIFYSCFRAFGSIAVLYFIKADLSYFFYWQSFVALVFACLFGLALWYYLPRSAKTPSFSKKMFDDIWQYAGFASLNSVMGIVIMQVDKIILSKLLSLKDFGYYSLAFTLSSALWIIMNPLTAAVFPHFSRIVAEGKECLETKYREICQLMDLILLPLTFLLVFNAKRVLLLWTQNASVAENASFLVVFMLLSTMCIGLITVLSLVRAATGWLSLVFYTNVSMIGILALAFYLFIPVYGARGAVVILFIHNLLGFCIYVFFTHRKILQGMVFTWLKYEIAIPLLSVLAAAFLIDVFGYRGGSFVLDVIYLAFMYSILLMVCTFSTSFNRKRVLSFIQKIWVKGASI